MKPHDLIHNGLYMVADTVVRYNALNGYLYLLYGAFFGKIYEDRETGKLEVLLDNGVWEEVKPIPLTAEILEKIGFKAIYAPEDYRYDDMMLLTQSYDKKGYWWVVGNCYVCLLRYVHQLQHALRLCGLDDLADNFQI